LSYCPRSSLPVEVLAWLAGRLAHLIPPRPPGQGGNRPLALAVRLDAVAAVVLDGLSYRRAARVVGISKTEVATAWTCCWARSARWGSASPTARSSLPSPTCANGWRRWPRPARRSAWTGWRPGVQRPSGWTNQKVLYDAKRHTHTAQGLALSTIHGDLLWCDGGWPGSCHEQDLLALSGLDQALDVTDAASLVDRGFRGLAKTREHWHAPIGDRRTKDRLSDGQRAYNRCQAGLRALVEQSIGHLANAWALRRWRGLLYRLRDVFRAAGALVCLGRWLHRVPT
jgi:hypothetical protein